MSEQAKYTLFKLLIERNRLSRARHNYVCQKAKLRSSTETVFTVSFIGNKLYSIYYMDSIYQNFNSALKYCKTFGKISPATPTSNFSGKEYNIEKEHGASTKVKIERVSYNGTPDPKVSSKLVDITLKHVKVMAEKEAFTARTYRVRRQLGRKLGTLQCNDDRGVITGIYLGVVRGKGPTPESEFYTEAGIKEFITNYEIEHILLS